MSKENRTATIASIPSREHGLRYAIKSLMPQIDEIHVYLNGYGAVPDFLRHDRIRYFRGRDLGDRGKFHTVEHIKGYHFTCDDDILYPPDYVETLIRHIDAYDRQYLFGVHGRVMLPAPIAHYYDTKATCYHLTEALADAEPVHIIGAGTMAYHTDTIQFHPGDFVEPNMADIWVGLRCQRERIGCMVVPRRENWLAEQESPDSLYWRFRKNDAVQTQIFNSHATWELIAKKKDTPAGPAGPTEASD